MISILILQLFIKFRLYEMNEITRGVDSPYKGLFEEH